MTNPSDWRRARSANAAGQERLLAERRATETAQARGLIATFLTDAAAAGLEPEPLFARDYSGAGRYRTGLTGWYLRINKSVGIDTEGNFYILTVPGGVLARLRGQTPEPTDPPLILGRGARDGESIDLSAALARVLDRG